MEVDKKVHFKIVLITEWASKTGKTRSLLVPQNKRPLPQQHCLFHFSFRATCGADYSILTLGNIWFMYPTSFSGGGGRKIENLSWGPLVFWSKHDLFLYWQFPPCIICKWTISWGGVFRPNCSRQAKNSILYSFADRFQTPRNLLSLVSPLCSSACTSILQGL